MTLHQQRDIVLGMVFRENGDLSRNRRKFRRLDEDWVFGPTLLLSQALSVPWIKRQRPAPCNPWPRRQHVCWLIHVWENNCSNSRCERCDESSWGNMKCAMNSRVNASIYCDHGTPVKTG